MIKIGNVELDNPVIIAPMAGISNAAFRNICKKFGAGLICAEMVSDKAIFYNNKKTNDMLFVDENEHPMSLQLFGHDIETMVYAAKILDKETNCDIIDINMGCPVTKVIKAQAGSHLMREVDHAAAIVKAIVEAVDKPVTVKMRAGWDKDNINAVELAKKVEAAGASAVAVHGRTKVQMYEGKPDWSIIKQVKEAVSIPVIGNGDIKSVDDMIAMMEQTGCDAVMIGRGILGDPWLIKECVDYIKSGKRSEGANYLEKFALAREHAQKLCDLKGEKVGIREMRGHAAWYLKGLPSSNRVKDQISTMNTYEEFDTILIAYQQKLEDYIQSKGK